MQDPCKLIYKFKNKNRRIQYHIYIFLGKFVPKKILNILEKIKNLSFYDTLVQLNPKEIQNLVHYYQEFWYEYFFNSYHLYHQKQTIKGNTARREDIIKKLGQNWYTKHIEEFPIRKINFFKYETEVAEEKERLMKKNLRWKPMEEELKGSFLTFPGIQTVNPTRKILEQNEVKLSRNTLSSDVVSFDTDEEEKEEKGDTDEEEEPFLQTISEEEEEKVETEEIPEEVEDFYQEAEVESAKEAKKTKELISKAIEEEKIVVTFKSVDFDISKDGVNIDENLVDVYQKHYLTNIYLYKDDTIKTIKNKITVAIKLDPAFGSDYLLGSRMYLWTEYYHQQNIEKVMLGQKWLRRNELLPVDIEPNNNLRVYEELRFKLKLLRDNIKRYGGKIKREDDENNILFDYNDYMTGNEIYMIDIYHELGLGYSPSSDDLKNLTDVYLRLYFPKVRDDINNIISFLNENRGDTPSKTTDFLHGNAKLEHTKILSTYDNVKNDLLLEIDIMDYVDEIKINEHAKYEKYFKESYVIQSFIHVNLFKTEKNKKVDLFRIFDNFLVNETYPFVQYHTLDGQLVFKYDKKIIQDKKKEISSILTKWFESSPFGISFKMRISDLIKKPELTERYMVINLNDTGMIEYKTQWKEEDMASVDDVVKTYKYVRQLIEKINLESAPNIKLHLPQDHDFKHAFINTIQKIDIHTKQNINHNDLSEFARYFFPYVTLVIEPRKRESKLQKVEEKGKFGTYLRYKRISKYENPARIEHRIYYFMRNYDYTDQSLANEISKQFNITEKQAYEEIEKVRSKFKRIKKSRKVLKKMEDAPKYKPPGIQIDIQGKTHDKYKVRISGARDKEQLNRITEFTNILIYLYVETYLLKRKERQELISKLKILTNIAKRRHRVEEIVEYEKEKKSVKIMAQMDKERLGFKPEKGENQYTRACQNSGEDKKRRPQFWSEDKIKELLKKGYKLNPKNKTYERTVTLGKNKKVVLRAVALKSGDQNIYYTCDPEENGIHTFIGFLSKSKNPTGLCMPCCFKKDPIISKNKEKVSYFLKCVGKEEKKEKSEVKGKEDYGDKIYILQDTNKIQNGKFGFLPRLLDVYLNTLMKHTRLMKSHYLTVSKTGYLLKYGTTQNKPFLNAISSALGMSDEQILNKISQTLIDDKHDKIFTSLNNGDIKTQFKTRDAYINYLKNQTYLEYELLHDILNIPQVVHPQGINIIVFQKITYVIKQSFEKEKIKEDFNIVCGNMENIQNFMNSKIPVILLLREFKNYYPIFMVIKPSEGSQGLVIKKIFYYENQSENLIHHIYDYYKLNCSPDVINKLLLKEYETAKTIVQKLENINDKNYRVKYQVIDKRNKCIYLITQNHTIIPLHPCGSLDKIDITNKLDSLMSDFDQTIEKAEKITKISEKNINLTPIGVYYDKKMETQVNVVGILVQNNLMIPIIPTLKEIKFLENHHYTMEDRQVFDKIDQAIVSKKIIPDIRIKKMEETNYEEESYQTFRLELSNFIQERPKMRTKMIKIIESQEDTPTKKLKIGKIIYRHVDPELYHLFVQTLQPDTTEDTLDTSKNKLVEIIDPNKKITDDFKISNNREICAHQHDKESCQKCQFCSWKYKKCLFKLTKESAVIFINKVLEELTGNNLLKMMEILQIGNYFVSDIVDYTKFTERKGQKIIKSSNNMLKKTLREIFGEEEVPQIGKKRLYRTVTTSYVEYNEQKPLKDLGDIYLQEIIENNISYFRAYVNAVYWQQHEYHEIHFRNLGYLSELQTDISNYYKSLVIEWLNNRNNVEKMIKDSTILLKVDRKKIWNDLVQTIRMDSYTLTNGVIEYYILSQLHDIPIILTNENGEIIYIFHQGKISKKLNQIDKSKSVQIVYSYISGKEMFGNGVLQIPDKISVIYKK